MDWFKKNWILLVVFAIIAGIAVWYFGFYSKIPAGAKTRGQVLSEITRGIKATPEWLKKITDDAKAAGIDVNKSIADNATYVLDVMDDHGGYDLRPDGFYYKR